MAEPLRIAVLSRWHVHADEYAKAVNDHPDARVAAVWDENPERGRKWAGELGVEFVADYAALLARRDIDGVVVTSPTDMHRELIVGAARAGKHVFTEKVLATTLDDAHAIADAVRASSIHFTISFPRRTIGPLLHAKAMLDDGRSANRRCCAFASRTTARLRTGCRRISSTPCVRRRRDDRSRRARHVSVALVARQRRVRCTSIFNSVTGRAVEDNAVSVIEFENNAVAINETSFVSWGGAYSVEIDGTQGGFADVEPTQRPHAHRTTTRRGSRPICRRTKRCRFRAGSTAFAAPAPPTSAWASTKRCELSEMMHAAYRSHRERRFDRLRNALEK